MSATLPNLDMLAAWLNADLYRTDYRPVPLTECFKMGTALYDSSLNLMRDIDTTYAVKVGLRIKVMSCKFIDQQNRALEAATVTLHYFTALCPPMGKM